MVKQFSVVDTAGMLALHQLNNHHRNNKCKSQEGKEKKAK